MKGRSREQVRAQGEVGQWCEPGQARGELQSEHCSRVFPQWVKCLGLCPTCLRHWTQAALGMVWPLARRLSAAEANSEGADSCGWLLTSPSTPGQLVLPWRAPRAVCFCIYHHLTNSIKWEDHYLYPWVGIVGIKWDCTFKVLSPVGRGNNCSIILLFKPIQQTLYFPPKPFIFFCNYYLLWQNVHKMYCSNHFKCTVWWH